MIIQSNSDEPFPRPSLSLSIPSRIQPVCRLLLLPSITETK
jgi:hypothetical protein